MSGFTNTVKAEWLEDDRRMRLLEPIGFIDSHGTLWKADAGRIIDGASIPRVFWRLIGGPFSGRYRRASVIHDVYCQDKKRPHQMVHNCFDEMTQCDQSEWQWMVAKAVKWFGPTW